MKVSRVIIENYRNLKHVDVRLEKIVTIIGENNSGKSNFLRAITLPLSSEDGASSSKRLTWYDFNREAKQEYYDYLTNNKDDILGGKISCEEFAEHLPIVSVQIDVSPEETEHYDIKNILFDDTEHWIGRICYHFYSDRPAEIIEPVKNILKSESVDEDIYMSLLPSMGLLFFLRFTVRQITKARIVFYLFKQSI